MSADRELASWVVIMGVFGLLVALAVIGGSAAPRSVRLEAGVGAETVTSHEALLDVSPATSTTTSSSTTVPSTTSRPARPRSSRGTPRHAGQFEATCYSLTGSTATGTKAGPGSIAVDPQVIPLGSRLLVEGYGEGTAVDTGGAIKGHRIDVWKESGCLGWGRRWVNVEVIG